MSRLKIFVTIMWDSKGWEKKYLCTKNDKHIYLVTKVDDGSGKKDSNKKNKDFLLFFLGTPNTVSSETVE